MEANQGAGPLRRDDLPEVLLTRVEAAAYLGLSVKRLANLRALGRGPACVRFPCGSVTLRVERASGVGLLGTREGRLMARPKLEPGQYGEIAVSTKKNAKGLYRARVYRRDEKGGTPRGFCMASNQRGSPGSGGRQAGGTGGGGPSASERTW